MMTTGRKKRGKTNLTTSDDLMGENMDQIIGGPASRPYYSKKVVVFH